MREATHYHLNFSVYGKNDVSRSIYRNKMNIVMICEVISDIIIYDVSLT